MDADRERIWTDLGCCASDIYAGQNTFRAFPCMHLTLVL